MNDGVSKASGDSGTAMNRSSRLSRSPDAKAIVFTALFLSAALIIQVTTRATEVARMRIDLPVAEIWLLEASSIGVIFALAFLIPATLDGAPQERPFWRFGAYHAAAASLFSVLHVAIMYAARLALFPPLLARSYGHNLLEPMNFFYEFRKDAFTYMLLAGGFVAIRAMNRRAEESHEATEQARGRRTITLRSGASAYFVGAPEIIRAKAAANYVEVVTATKTYLARMTLARLEELLKEAGGRHVRVHRSHLVNLDAVRELKPTGEGDLTIVLADGSSAPCSRTYRPLVENLGLRPPLGA